MKRILTLMALRGLSFCAVARGRSSGSRKKLLLIFVLALVTSVSAFGQGYVVFATTKAQGVYYNGWGNVTVGFMWANSGIPLVGTNGIATDGSGGGPMDWSLILADPIFRFATNANDLSLVSAAVNNIGLAQGGWAYNSGVTFPLRGALPGSTIKIFAVAWSSAYATPFAAAAGGSFLGYSGLFNYTTAPDSGSAASSFAGSGMHAFGIISPEPSSASLVLAGLVCWFLTKRRLPPQ